MFWAVVLKAVALSEANTLELTNETPPIAATPRMATNPILEVNFDATVVANFWFTFTPILVGLVGKAFGAYLCVVVLAGEGSPSRTTTDI